MVQIIGRIRADDVMTFTRQNVNGSNDSSGKTPLGGGDFCEIAGWMEMCTTYWSSGSGIPTHEKCLRHYAAKQDTTVARIPQIFIYFLQQQYMCIEFSDGRRNVLTVSDKETWNLPKDDITTLCNIFRTCPVLVDVLFRWIYITIQRKMGVSA